MKATGKNGKIELLRFIFCLCIMLVHTEYFVPDGVDRVFPRAALGVEFFFLVSGYLMACTCWKKSQSTATLSLGRETQQFIGKKILTIMPNFLIAWVIAFLVSELSKLNFTLPGLLGAAADQIWEVLLIAMAGFGTVRANSVDWYISAMLLAMLVLYPICRKRFDLFVRILAPVIALFLLGYFARTDQTLVYTHRIVFGSYKGLIRAFAMVSLGAACFPLIRWLSDLKLSRLGRGLVTVVEAVAYVGAVFHFATGQGTRFDFLCALLIVVGVCLSFSGQGLLTQRFNHPVCMALGKFSLSLYLCHGFWGRALNRVYDRQVAAGLVGADPQGDFFRMLVIYFALALPTALIVFFLSEWLKKKAPALGTFLKGKLLDDKADPS